MGRYERPNWFTFDTGKLYSQILTSWGNKSYKLSEIKVTKKYFVILGVILKDENCLKKSSVDNPYKKGLKRITAHPYSLIWN